LFATRLLAVAVLVVFSDLAVLAVAVTVLFAEAVRALFVFAARILSSLSCLAASFS
jgi:hypothetical protein